MLVLHQMQMSGNCYKVRLAARQTNTPVALREYGLHDGSTRLPGYLAKNPNGRVPLLELADGRHLPESGAILWYLGEGTALVPESKWDRSQMLNWMFFEQYSHEPYIAVARFWLKYAAPQDLAKKQHLVPEWHARGDAALGVMETHLSAHDWFAAKRYTIADIALYGYTHSAADGGFDLSRYPAVSRWLKRVAGQPGHIPLGESW
ncbi:MAG: glutathione S-transferase family protein [Rhizomicrobium sp.]